MAGPKYCTYLIKLEPHPSTFLETSKVQSDCEDPALRSKYWELSMFLHFRWQFLPKRLLHHHHHHHHPSFPLRCLPAVLVKCLLETIEIFELITSCPWDPAMVGSMWNGPVCFMCLLPYYTQLVINPSYVPYQASSTERECTYVNVPYRASSTERECTYVNVLCRKRALSFCTKLF